MSREDLHPKGRRIELLCDQALSGLSPEEAAELAALPGAEADLMAFDLAAAAIDLGCFDEAIEPLPEALRARIEKDWEKRADPVVKEPPPAPRAPAAVVPLAEARRARKAEAAKEAAPRAPSTPAPGGLGRHAGWIAAAACFALAVGAWLTRPEAPPPVVIRPPELPSATPPETPKRPKAPAEQREALLAEAKDAVRIAWSATKDPGAAGASGDVVWSQAEQRGYMRFHGLPPNDPQKAQFQLWIFDKSRDDRYPVDGGVFDVDAATGDVIVPITAKLKVDRPALFAITVEPPGGVVVSKREHLVLTAAVSSPG